MTDTIGRLLKQARTARQIPLEEASEATHIRLHYLQALEADDYSVMPSAAQARGFLRNYSSYLEVDLEGALAGLKTTPHAEEVSGPLPQVDFAPPPPEPATSSRPTVPSRPGSRVERSRNAPAAPSAPEPEIPSRLDQLTGALRKLRPAKQEPVEQQAGPEPAPETEDEGRTEEPKPRWNPLRGLFKPRPLKPEEPPQDEEHAEESTEEPPIAVVEPPPAVTDADETAEKIFAEIGMELRRRRELLSLTPEEVDRHIHVREVFIRALERGDFSELPSAVQTRGMLANYAAFLDLDTDALLLRYADSLQASHRARHPNIPGRARQSFLVKPKVPPLRSFMAGDLVFGLALVVMVVALIVWGLGRVFQDQAERVILPAAPSISDVLAGTSNPLPSQEITLIPVLSTPTVVEIVSPTSEVNLEVPPFEPVDESVPVRVTVSAVERGFMRVMIDGEEAFNGRVIPGAAYNYEATTTIQILTGNGAALRVTYNGRDLGLLGTFGQVANFIYTANEIVTPVPAAPPTSTATPPVSQTPTLTPTVTRTPTTTP